MKKIRVCSLFSGIGGFETGIFDALGKEHVDVVFASEINKQASFAYEQLYGHAPYGDITQIDAKEVPDHDLLVGGFPCQSFSSAGKKLGFLDETRGTLFFDIIRIAAEKKPTYMILENVKGLVGHDHGKTMEVIVQTLSDLGYKIDFKVMNSRFHGVPQHRERIFFVCSLLAKEEEWMIPKGENIELKMKHKMKGLGIKTFNFPFHLLDAKPTFLRDIMENDVEEKYYMHGKFAKKNIPMKEIQEKLEREIRHIVAKSRPKESISINFKENGDIRPHRNDPRKSGISELNINHEQNCSFTITASHPPKVYGEKTGWRIRKLTPLEAFRLQSFPDDYYHTLKNAGVSDGQLYKMAGNAVTTSVVRDIVLQMKEEFIEKDIL